MNNQDLFSPYIMVPVQAESAMPGQARTLLDWRGIPLAVPYRFDSVQPGETMRIVKRWKEGKNIFLKLAHPLKGTTVDYTVRSLFNPSESTPSVTKRIFCFMEIGPGCPEAGKTVPVWTVVEVLRPDNIRTLSMAEINTQWN